MRRPRSPLALLALVALVLAGPARAADPFPAKPIELIVPTPPGGGTDIAARILAETTEPFLGQKLVVVNKPGGGGTVGMTLVTQGSGDGYTLGVLWNAPLTILPHTLSVPYSTSDYVVLTQITAAPLVFCVKPDFPAGNGAEFLQVLKQSPGKFTVGNDGVGGLVQLAGERIFRAKGIKVRPVPFGGAGETIKAFLGGHVDVYGGSLGPVIPHEKAGKAKCLLLTSRERNPTVPQASGLDDVGLPQAATVLWRGVIAPKTLPAERAALLEKAFRQGVQTPRFREHLAKGGEEAVGGSAAEFRELLLAEHQAFGEISRDLGLARK